MSDATTAPPRRPSTARRVADAVLYEGYVLYPYRASAAKNRYRWQWGVVVPAEQLGAAPDVTEPTELSCEVPLSLHGQALVTVAARFLQLCHRQVLDTDNVPVDRLEVDGELHLSWDEGHERELTTPPLSIERLSRGPHVQAVRLDAGTTTTALTGGGRVVRRFEEVVGELEVAAVTTGDGVVRLRAAVRNVTPWSDAGAARDQVLRRSLVGTHLLLTALGGAFGSVVDPPDWAQETVKGSDRTGGLHPVLAGDDRGDDVVLASPIILSDHPMVADESPGPSFDALEIDELTALAVQGMTEHEKREARATDPKAAELVDTFGALPPAVMERLHGTIREFGPGSASPALTPEPGAGIDDEMAEFFGVGEEPLDEVDVDGTTVALGDTVRLRPRRRADAHDLFADGRAARVERIVRTVDGPTFVAVTVDDDPAAELHRWYGRFQYFHLDEVETDRGGDQ